MRLFLLHAFSAFMLFEAYGFTYETDKQALLEFKSQVSKEKRLVLSSWNNSFPLCNWTGVTCGRKHKRVTSLDLGGLQLGGMISPFIGNLSFLRSLNLSDNSLSGTIPREVGNLFRLQDLVLDYNFLKGGIPTSLANCSRLLTLSLYSNPLGKGVPWELGSLTELITLDLGRTKLKGKLPASLGNLTSLTYLDFRENNIEGGIPHDIARLTQLDTLDLSTNHLTGVFPPFIYNMSTLSHLNVASNGFRGSLRPDFGSLLPNLRMIYMGINYLTGAIPTTLSNISTLVELGMEYNILKGNIPPGFGKLSNLQHLTLQDNFLGGDLDFLDALTNCTKLHTLVVGNNTLGGHLPTSISNLSKNLIDLGLEMNHISGRIPHDIGNLVNLQSLWLSDNLLTGPLPVSIGKLSSLRGLSVSNNKLSGEIPSSIGNISLLSILYMTNNSFQGIIPPSLGNCSYLLELFVDNNKLNGAIPREIMGIPPLVLLNMFNNSLTGSLPEDIGRLGHIVKFDVSHNKLSGKLPRTLGKCLSLEEIYLEGNSFDGSIPNISGLLGVKTVDFSNNNLSGGIPGYLAKFNSLEYLNLSGNNFEGRVPTEGKFKNATIVSVSGNVNLCGGILELKLKPCFSREPNSSRKKVLIGVGIGMFVLLLLFIVSASLFWFKRRKKTLSHTPTPSTFRAFHEQISYSDLRNATDGFSSSNLIGSGSFGTVFKAMFPQESKVVAVKVLNLQRHGAMKSFMAECKSLKDVRHRNLVKLLTACSSIDFQGNEFRALIYEFMPNGNLDMWLHPEEVEETRRPSRALTLFERLNIAIDVASVLDYLHVHCHEAIAHCDIKPSNILLDDDLTARVSDFGLARILFKQGQESFFNQLSSAGIKGTIGYVAPEYGMGGQISIHGDVYSFGILLLEIISGKRPTNELFQGNFTLISYIKSAIPEKVVDVADESMLHNGLRAGFPLAECLTLVLEVGLRCCEESPTNRLGMSEVLRELISIRMEFFRPIRRARQH